MCGDEEGPRCEDQRRRFRIRKGRRSSHRRRCVGRLHAEVTLVEDLTAEVIVTGALVPLIADQSYDSDPHGEGLKARGFDLVCPHRRGR